MDLYNSHMGGVDKSDMMVALNRLPTRARRWYIPFIGYFIDLALVNSYLVYQRQAVQLKKKQEISTCKEFRQQVSPLCTPPKDFMKSNLFWFVLFEMVIKTCLSLNIV